MGKIDEFRPLSKAEEQLLAQIPTGNDCPVGDGTRPEEEGKTADNAVRADFIRFLAMGGDDDTFVHEKGVKLTGAWIEGALDFEDSEVTRPIALEKCWFENPVILRDANTHGIVLTGSRVPGIRADRLIMKSGIYLGPDFLSEGEIRLAQAVVSGGFVATGATISVDDGDALTGDGMTVHGDVFLNDGFTADGGVRFPGARIFGDITFSKGLFRNADRRAIIADGITVSGTLFFRDVIEVSGTVDLTSASVGDLVDEVASWPSQEQGGLILDGFTYERISGNAPTDFTSRKVWLEKQQERFLKTDFRPQPFEELVKTLRQKGHNETARRIGILKQDYQVRARWRSGCKTDDRLHGVLGRKLLCAVPTVRLMMNVVFKYIAGYGYRPGWALIWAMGFVLFGAWFFNEAYSGEVMVPSSPSILSGDTWVRCTDKQSPILTLQADAQPLDCWLSSPAGREYPRFQPFIYSLDTFVPILKLHQESNWMPQPERGKGTVFAWARLYLWGHIILGWIFTTLTVAGFSGLIKKT